MRESGRRPRLSAAAALSSSCVVVLFFVLLLASDCVDAVPRTRTIKQSSSHHRGTLENSLLSPRRQSSKPTCERNVPCGWALYHQTWRSALRPIFQYTRNTFCECAVGSQCVYQENRSEMRAYVFYCRKNEQARDLYRFPNLT